MNRPKQAENLIKIGALHEEKHAPEEIRSHIARAEEHLQAAKVEHLAPSVRYINAYNAVHHIGLAGLRALDLRPSDRAGARDKTIQALAWTLNVRSELMPVLVQSNTIRGRLEYSPTEAGAIGTQELAALMKAAEEIIARARKLIAPEPAPETTKKPASR